MKTIDKNVKTNTGLLHRTKAVFTTMVSILFCCTLLISCGGDDDEDKPAGKNQFTYDGQIITATGGSQLYYGHTETFGTNANNVNLILSSADYKLHFTMFVPNDKDRLVAETYTKANTNQAFTYRIGLILNSGGVPELMMTGGTITIAVSGNTYTIDVNCTLNDGNTIVGNYTGTLTWYDESEDQPIGGANKFTYNNQSYTVSAGIQEYYGHYEGYGNDANNITLGIVGSDFAVGFEMFVPNGKTKLVAGTYNKASSYQPYTYLGGGIFNEDFSDFERTISSGTVTIAVSGSTYTIDVNCTLDNGKSLTGNYTGTLEWSDESAGSTEAKSMNATKNIFKKAENTFKAKYSKLP